MQRDSYLKDYALMSIVHVLRDCVIVTSINYYRIILSCNLKGSAGGEGHAYPSGATDVTSGFFTGVHSARAEV